MSDTNSVVLKPSAFYGCMGVNDHSPPIAAEFVSGQVEKDFCKQPRIKSLIPLKLDFHKKEGIPLLLREEEAIDTEGELFDLDGAEAIVFS
ncbi:MAG: hypothetical protein SNJ85_11345 [Cyanobacteriota bacterium]